MIRIAVDMMGGDCGIDSNVGGILRFIRNYNYNDVVFDLFGNITHLETSITKLGGLPIGLCTIHDTGDRMISSDERASIAIKRGGGTSMFEAISHVALKRADAVVSSGNTGAYMALSKTVVGMIPGIIRPALVSIIPNIRGRSVMLDLGANTDCSSIQLAQFAAMGSAVAKVLLSVDNPSVALLNIGTERSKGTETLDEAYKILEGNVNINFSGFIEGTDIGNGTSDVIVTDGFSGNVSLKTMEGTIMYLLHLAKEEVSKSFFCKLGYFFCRGMLSSIRNSLDPSRHNGAPLVGLRNIVIKSHGNADAIGFATAISSAVTLAKSKFISNITENLASLKTDDSGKNPHENRNK
ncbi:MAG: phosphate acyltransferase PlsX [Holosporales bacterium]|jgi:glycerol-3-phosphate acyltransferase PlsX|nr:phosphate acyltransferase PlsX [Holosporales bacterium]